MAKTAPTQRDQHVLAIESESRFAWKRTSGYYAQAYAENAFARFKQTSVTGSGRSELKPRSGKPRWRANCSIGCGNWVALSPMRLAESGVQRATSSAARFMQQRRFILEINGDGPVCMGLAGCASHGSPSGQMVGVADDPSWGYDCTIARDHEGCWGFTTKFGGVWNYPHAGGTRLIVQSRDRSSRQAMGE